jgi:hypothetical protein
MLIVQISTKSRIMIKNKPLKIYLKQGKEIKYLTKSSAWNWQQGCMLQWYAASNDTIIYNDFSYEKNHYISIIRNITTGNDKTIDFPVYSVSNSGDFALTLNFERLALMRPDYGYFNRNIKWEDLPDDHSDGIWFVDLKKNSSKLILSLDTLKNYQPSETMNGAHHKVNHIDISPDGKRFMFLHRWVGPQGRFMRLLTADSHDGSGLYYITGDQMVSHNCWLGNREIISFCRLPDGRDRYVRFRDQQSFSEIIGDTLFNKDGHPSVSPDGHWMLTDDYPDKSRFSRLYLYHLNKKKKYIVGEFYQPLWYTGEKRIDLHPKWSPDGQKVSIDSGHTGKRKFYVVDVSTIVTHE